MDSSFVWVDVVVLLAGVVFVAAIIWANVANYRHRRSLTPEERVKHDAESSRIRGDW